MTPITTRFTENIGQFLLRPGHIDKVGAATGIVYGSHPSGDRADVGASHLDQFGPVLTW